MKRLVAVVAVFFFLVCARLGGQAQSFADRTQWHGGVLLEFFPISFPDGQSFFLNDQLVYGIHLGGEYTLAHSEDFIALNLDAGLTFSFNYSNVFGTTLLAQVPAFVVAKIGAGATPYSESVVGLSVGVGATYTYINLPYATDPFLTEVFRLKPSWLSPAAMAQVTVNINGALYGLRGHVNLGSYTDTEGITQLRYENYGIGLIYNF